jgi:sarcosine oxidase
MTRHPDEADVVVIGLGVHGSAVAASLARRGRRVIALDRFPSGHERGSSHGRTRMIRRAYPNPVWNEFVDRAYVAWAALEAETGERLVHRTGGLYAHRAEPHLAGPDCVVLDDPGELERRMPGLAVPAGFRAVYDPGAGVIEAAAAVVLFVVGGLWLGAHELVIHWWLQLMLLECAVVTFCLAVEDESPGLVLLVGAYRVRAGALTPRGRARHPCGRSPGRPAR